MNLLNLQSSSKSSPPRRARHSLVSSGLMAAAAALVTTFAIGSGAQADLPKNTLGPNSPVYISHDRFVAIQKKFLAKFGSLVSSSGAGAKLRIIDSSSNKSVNAYANQVGKDWTIEMLGGLETRSEVSEDGYAMIMCHELGHHLAGYPFNTTDYSFIASVEGMSDWYAAHTCAPLLWGGEDNINSGFRKAAPASVRDRCDKEWKTAPQQNLCYRIAMAAKSMGDLLAAIPPATALPDHAINDTTTVSTTNLSHPRAQCRLDTMENGALCTIAPNAGVIPGWKFANKNGPEAEREAALSSCMPASALVGAKLYNKQDIPACWFKPQVTK